ncbi:MAG: FHA domain-containing protein [Muribaculaceae bacterium]|nr:FHA domain-containing protein [Muribaculaceae bacterium]
MSRFKKCPKGHTYKADAPECPICKRSNAPASQVGSLQTTQIISAHDEVGLKTTTDDAPISISVFDKLDPHKDYSKTMIEEEILEEDESGAVVNRVEVRAASKLVGWLVTYSLDPQGVDFRLFEGRNILGKDFSCSVCINDSKVSAQHAILLYRNGKFMIKDNLSTNGTYVNGEDIEDDSVVLNDGDIIQIGDTILLFRTSELPK